MVSSGIVGFDRLLGQQGFFPGEKVLVQGPAGSGKSTFGLQFIFSGLQSGEAGLLLHFEKSDAALRQQAASFGWDIPAAVKAGKLLLRASTPENLKKDLQGEGKGLLAEMKKAGVKRLFMDGGYALAQLGLQPRELGGFLETALPALQATGANLLWAQDFNVGLEQNLADTIVLLNYELKDGLSRRRLMEVLKARGQAHASGKHLFEIGAQGLEVLPNLSGIEPLVPKKRMDSTGIPRLDEMMGGGMPFGSVFLFTTDGLATSYPFFIAQAAAGLAARQGIQLTPSSRNNLFDVQRFLMDHSYDISGLSKSGQIRFVDYYDRPAPEELKPYIFNASRASLAQLRLGNQKMEKHFDASKLRWRRILDVNAEVDQFGPNDFKALHSTRLTNIKTKGHLGILFAVLKELDEATAAFLRYTSSGIVHTWVEEGYQFIQVLKTPSGRISAPGVVESIAEKPFLRIR